MSAINISSASSVVSDSGVETKSSTMLATVLKLEKELAKMKIALGVEGVKTPKKARKAKDPGAPKKEPNVWIKFTQRVGELLKTTDHKGPATIGKQFASHLKDVKPYDEWTDAEILHQFSSWTPPVKGSAPAEAAPAEVSAAEMSATEEGFATAQSEPESAPAPKKKGGKPAKEASIPPPPPAPPAKAEPSPVVKMLTETLAAAAATGAFKPKGVKSKVTYTPEQLANFTEFEYNGETYGRNERNDVVDGDSNFKGRWNAATSKIEACPEPADWLQIFL